MNRTLILLCAIGMFLIPSSYTLKRIDYRDAMHKNVCKDLKGEVLIYYIFVDNKETLPWTEFDVHSTIDSINIAVKWLQQMAKENSIDLKIKTDYYIGKDYTTITKNLAHGSIIKTINEVGLKKGIDELNLWSDFIAKRAGASFQLTEKDGIPEIKNPRNKERLIAYLRDEYKVESVALLFFLNNYFRTDISLQVNTFDTKDVEFAVVSYKYPSEIAHNFLHLFGAADLYKTPYRHNEKKIKFAEKEFPQEIMQDPYARNIWDLNISSYTRYLIGWDKELAPEYQNLLTDKIIQF